jgi:hypothetical protein
LRGCGFCCAAFSFSAWAVVSLLFPVLAPLVRVQALLLPDRGLLRMKAARGTIVNSVAHLIRVHRRTLEVASPSLACRIWLSKV